MKKTIRILAALVCVLAITWAGFALAEAPAEAAPPAATPATATPSPTPTVTPRPTPSEEDLGKLTFVVELVEGEGETAVTTTVTEIPYSAFTDGKFTVEDLAPGKYSVREVDPDKLLTEMEYTFDTENSVQSVTFEVTATESPAVGTLRNVYEREAQETPSPTPGITEEPSPTPEAPETPSPEPDEKITIPVVKSWDDSANRDHNRPDHITVHLLANGNPVAQAVLTAATGWRYDFIDLPKYSGENEIVYTVTEDPVNMYQTSINGYNITNIYNPPVTSATVSKVWIDNGNAARLRPVSIYCRLSNGMAVVLNEGNNWTATVENLPAIVNGQPVTYTWSEQEAVGYRQDSVTVLGNTTVFTNSIIEREENPPEGKKTPTRKRGNPYLIIDDYGTPLGVDVIINHVGDCFD